MPNNLRPFRPFRNSSLVVGLLTAGLACAQEEGLDAESFLGEVPVFLTVTRLPQNLSETPASVMIIDRQMIEAAGVVEIPDLLRLVPGFVVGHYTGTDGNRTVVSYYGFSDQYARRLQVLVDGMSVYMPATGSVEWPDLPIGLDDIERIEVVRGPNGAAYGANAFLGVINIITRHPQESESKLTATAGSLGDREATFRVAGGERFQYRLSGGYRSSPGYRDLDFTADDTKGVNDSSITRSLLFRGDYRSDVNDYWTFQSGYANGPRQVGESADPTDPVRYQQMETDFQQLRWRHMIDSESQAQVEVYRNHHRKKDKFQTALLSEIFGVPPAVVQLMTGQPDQRLAVDTGIESERQNLEASYRFRATDDWRFVIGGEYRIDRAKGGNYFDTGDSFTNRGTRLFFNGEWHPTDQWTINLGDLYEKDDVIAGAHSPRLSIAHTLVGPHFVRATASRAYRIPAFVEDRFDFTVRLSDGTLFDRYYRSVGNLDPERIDNAELAIGADTGVFSYELKAFHNDVTTLISTPRIDPSHWVLKNGGRVLIEGTEFQATLRPEPDLLFALGVSRAHASGWYLFEDPGVRRDIADTVPEHTFSLLVSKQLPQGDQVGFNYYAVAPVRHFSGDPTDGVHTADLSYSRPFQVGGHRARGRLLYRDVTGSYFDFEVETGREQQVFLTLEIAP